MERFAFYVLRFLFSKKINVKRLSFNFLLIFFLGNMAQAQNSDQPLLSENTKTPFLQPADSLSKGRFWTCVAIGGTIYGSATYGLSTVWYAETERAPLHLFNDWGEWRHVDKAGHMFTAYNYTHWLYAGAKWTGMKKRKALWTAASLSFILQGTLEVMDGYSAKWGFSLPDVAFNTLGVGLFLGQELTWKEQRIIMKVSSTIPTYPTGIIEDVNGMNPVTYQERAQSLFGKKFPETFFKDYNAQTNWLSFNVHSFLGKKETRFPKWLNLAVGYGAQNMYEGFGYEWENEDTGFRYERDPKIYQRYSQFYLSLDIDLTRIKTKSRFLKTAFSIINFIKIPAPTLEINTLGKMRFIPIYF